MSFAKRGCVLVCVLGLFACSDKSAVDQSLGAAGISAAGIPGSGLAAGSVAVPLSGASALGTAGFGASIGFAAGGGAAGLSGAVGAGVPPGAAAPGSVLQYHAHANRDGLYVDPAFTRATAALIKQEPTFKLPIKGPTYAQPLFVAGAEGNDLLITATEQNEVSAFNALTGAVVWQHVLAPPGEPGCGGNIRPLGVTGTPVIDGVTRTLYVAAMTAGVKHMIYALSLDDGSVRPGWPVDVSTIKAGAVAFNAAFQHQRGALLLLNNMLYVPYGGNFQDCGEFHGWVVGVPLDNPAAPIAFATKGIGGGIWAPGGLASDGVSVIAATGNTMEKAGAINSSPATWGHGNAVLRLTPMGKAGKAYLLDQKRLGGMGGELKAITLSPGGIAGGLVQATTVYPAPTGMFAVFRSTQPAMGCTSGTGNFGALKLTAGAPPTAAMAWCAEGNGTGSPIVTSPDGLTDSVVWYFTGGRLMGVDGESGASIFRATDSLGYIDKFQTPIVAKGRLFVAASDAVYAFSVR
jgi:hypothetical protein